MNTKSKFQRAIKLMPDEEQLRSRRFVLFNNSLYFKGDRAWMIITDFMTGDQNISLTFADLELITSMEGTITVEAMAKANFYRFTNGSHRIDIACNAATEAPDITIPPAHEFVTMGNMLTRGRSIYGMSDPYAVVDLFNDGKKGYMALLSAKGLAGLTGDELLSMNITKMPAILKAAVAGKATMRVGDKEVCFRMEDTDHTIVTGMQVNKSSLPDKPKNVFLSTLGGQFEQTNIPGDVVTALVPTGKFLEMLPTLERMEYAGYVNLELNNNKLKLKTKDTTNREFQAETECEVTGNCKFGCRAIDRSIIDFLGDAAGRLDETKVKVVANLSHAVMVLTLVKDPTKKDLTPTQSEAFVMMKIDTSGATV